MEEIGDGCDDSRMRLGFFLFIMFDESNQNGLKCVHRTQSVW